MGQLKWNPNRNSPIPLYKQIIEYIKSKIVSGEWSVGSIIPTQRELAKQLGVNRSTLITAIEELKADGILEGKVGLGTKVVNNSWTLLSATAPPDWNSFVKNGIYQPNRSSIQTIYKSEMQPSMIRLGSGELSPEMYPTSMMQEIIRKLALKKFPFGYEEPKGSYSLRVEISKYLKSIGITAFPSSILIVSGALQALQLISIGILHKGSSVLLEKYSYMYSLHVFQSTGMRLVGIPIDESGLQPNYLPRYKKQFNGSILYTIPTFHNPTGILMSEDRRKKLLDVCEQEQLPMIEDDVYRELWLDKIPPQPIKAHDKNGIVLYLGSFSKTLSPGLRIGWVVGPKPVIERLADVKMQIDYGSSSLSQQVATEWLSSGYYHEHLERVRKNLKIRRDFMVNELERNFKDIASWKIPKGGFYIWVNITPEVSIHKLFDKALERGILLNPGYLYQHLNNRYIRFSYAYASLSDIKQGLREVAKLVNYSPLS